MGYSMWITCDEYAFYNMVFIRKDFDSQITKESYKNCDNISYK
jgi:hypothetical protein